MSAKKRRRDRAWEAWMVKVGQKAGILPPLGACYVPTIHILLSSLPKISFCAFRRRRPSCTYAEEDRGKQGGKGREVYTQMPNTYHLNSVLSSHWLLNNMPTTITQRKKDFSCLCVWCVFNDHAHWRHHAHVLPYIWHVCMCLPASPYPPFSLDIPNLYILGNYL